MFLRYFKLAVQPFGVTPDPEFLFLSSTHREAMATVLHGVFSGRGFTALIAEPGMGKTTLLFDLLGKFKRTGKTAFLFQTMCGPREFLHALLADLGIEDDGQDLTRMHAKLNECLLRESQQGRQLLVIIDEAQNLDWQVLEVVRMLSNFETATQKLMHVILAGQPQLAERLVSERLVQLRQRISMVARLAPFNADETRAYIEHRLQSAGFASNETLFTKDAYALIAEHSRGVPRNINNLCFNAMSLACALNRRNVDRLIVQEAIDDLDLRTLMPQAGRPENARFEKRSRLNSFFGVTDILSSSGWRLRALAALAFLALLGWPTYRAVNFAHGRSTRKGERTPSQLEPGSVVKKGEESSALALDADKQPAPQLGPRTAFPGESVRRFAGSIIPAEKSSAQIEVLVKPNQTLSGLSALYAGRYDQQILSEILALNPWLKDARGIRAGQTLKIPVANQQVARQIQDVLERSETAHQSAAQREKR
jgi:general secretion pathway protein A